MAEENESNKDGSNPVPKNLTVEAAWKIARSLGSLDSVIVPAGALRPPPRIVARTLETQAARFHRSLNGQRTGPEPLDVFCGCEACAAFRKYVRDISARLPDHAHRLPNGTEAEEMDIAREIAALSIASEGQTTGSPEEPERARFDAIMTGWVECRRRRRNETN